MIPETTAAITAEWLNEVLGDGGVTAVRSRGRVIVAKPAFGR